MKKILVAECKQEVSTFNPVLSHYDDFDIAVGQQIVDYHRGLLTEMGGALQVLAETPDVEVVPTYSARAITSAGTLSADGFRRIADEFLAAIRAAPPVDAVYFSLHGALASEDEPDPEGYLLQETRKILGESIPLVVSMDLHGILTDRILQQSDAVTLFHTYPHVDFYQTGQRAARLLLRILHGEVRPVTATVAVPALVRGNELITETGVFGQSIRRAQAIEADPKGLSAGMFIGNPFTDVPDLRCNSLVVTDDDPDLAEREAVAMATEFWSNRARMQAKLIDLDTAIERAMALEGPVIFTDAADATSSGASGDSNVILRRLRAHGYRGRVLLPIVDPGAVAQAMAAGVGERVRTTLGGSMDSGRFDPLPINAEVLMLSDGEIVSESDNSVWHAGPTAVLESANYTIIVTTRAVSLYDRSLFLGHGQDPQRFDLIVVKSPHCQPQFFDDWAEINFNVDAPGSTSANLHSLGHQACQRPIYPLEEIEEWAPSVKIFSRRG